MFVNDLLDQSLKLLLVLLLRVGVFEEVYVRQLVDKVAHVALLHLLEHQLLEVITEPFLLLPFQQEALRQQQHLHLLMTVFMTVGMKLLFLIFLLFQEGLPPKMVHSKSL